MAEEYFSLHMDPKFAREGRQIENIAGHLVVFENGIAQRVEKSIADYAKRLGHISRVLRHEINPTPVAAPVEEESSEEETANEEDTSEEATEEASEDSEAEHPDLESLTKEQIQSIYDDKGTWTAVAEELGVSTPTLKKRRDELGL